MNKINLYIAFLSLQVAISVLNYIPENEIEFIKILFFTTALGFLLTMIKENFHIKIKKINTLIIKIEDNFFYYLVLFITSYFITSIIHFILELIKLDIENNYKYVIFGTIGVLLKMIISKKSIS